MIDLEFPKPKDPQDTSWYVLRAPEPVASVLSITAAPCDPLDQTGVGTYSTPGDAATPSDLVPSSWSVPLQDTTASDGTVLPAGYAIVFQLAGGAPNTSYAVRAGFQTTSGSTLYRSAILVVTGL